MGLTSLHVCMDSSDWLQGSIHEDAGMDSSSPSGDMLACSRPLMERRLRPPHDQALKCPRCDSTHTKFCYYNNYSLSQPRYFCKTCRRYWTKGGTLRNIPVGGGCRKNKKASSSSSSSSSSKKPNDHHQSNIHTQNTGSSSSSSHNSPIDLQLSIPEVQLSHLTNLLGSHGGIGNPSFMESQYNAVVENPVPIDFMESKYEALVGSSRNYDFMGNGVGLGEMNHGFGPYNFQHCCSPFGMMSLDDHGNTNDNNNNNNSGLLMDTCQRLMLPYVGNGDQDQTTLDVKPNTKLLSLEWQDQGCSDAGNNKDLSLGYINSVGSWSGGLMNGYGSSPTNPLV